MDNSHIKETLERGLSSIKLLEIKDDSHLHQGHFETTGGSHLRLKIVSDDFKGKTQIARHRLIQSLLKEEFQKKLHALSIEAYTEAEAQL